MKKDLSQRLQNAFKHTKEHANIHVFAWRHTHFLSLSLSFIHTHVHGFLSLVYTYVGIRIHTHLPSLSQIYTYVVTRIDINLAWWALHSWMYIDIYIYMFTYLHFSLSCVLKETSTSRKSSVTDSYICIYIFISLSHVCWKRPALLERVLWQTAIYVYISSFLSLMSRKMCVHVCVYIIIHMTGEPFGLLSHVCQKWPI